MWMERERKAACIENPFARKPQFSDFVRKEKYFRLIAATTFG